MFFNFFLSGILMYSKSLHYENAIRIDKNSLYMKPFDPLSTDIPLKNSFSIPPKKIHRHQWLQNLNQIGVNGSTF